MVMRATGSCVVAVDCEEGRLTLIAFGTTSVLTTIKKISSRKMTSVIDAMLNTDICLLRLLILMSLALSGVARSLTVR